MGSGRRISITPSMAVALTALAIALGGSAFAASGVFENAGGVVQACVTQSNIVRDVAGVIDGATGKAFTPGTQGVNGLVDGTKVLTPRGTVLAVTPGEKCPAGSTPQDLAAPVPVTVANGKPTVLGETKRRLASVMLPGGSYLIDATAKITSPGESSVIHTIKCALTGPDGRTLPGTTSQATIPAGSPDERLTIPMSSVVSDLPAGEVSAVCKDSAPAEKRSSGARAAGAASTNPSVSFEANDPKKAEIELFAKLGDVDIQVPEKALNPGPGGARR